MSVKQLTSEEASKLEAMQNILASVLENMGSAEEPLSSKAADIIAGIMGSWKFLVIQGIILVCYMILNQALLSKNAFDPYPFILLNLVLSFQAAFTAPVILMAQNRADAKDRRLAKKAYRTIGHIEELMKSMVSMEDSSEK